MSKDWVVIVAFEHTHASGPYNSGFDKEIAYLRYHWGARTGGFMNSYECMPAWNLYQGQVIERTYYVRFYVPYMTGQLFKHMTNEEFLNLVDFSYYIKEYDLKNLRIEKVMLDA